jgi:hypothetical protein
MSHMVNSPPAGEREIVHEQGKGKTMFLYVIAIVLLMHAIGHIMPFMAAWTPQKVGFSGASWLFSSGVSVGSPVGQAFGLLGLLALLGFCAGALGLVTHQQWWPALTVAAAAISIVAIVPWVSAWPLGSAISALLVDVAVLVALLPPWADRLIHAF